MRNPLMDNEHQVQITRVSRQTRGLKRSVFRDSIWPKIESFRWTIPELTKAKRDSFFAFVVVSLGKQIRLTDFESRQWDGIISDPNEQSSQIRSSCGYIISFTFEGTLV